MEKRDDGVFIPNEDIEQVKKMMGWIGIGFLVFDMIRLMVKRQFSGRQ